jgi:hypothetical protein
MRRTRRRTGIKVRRGRSRGRLDESETVTMQPTESHHEARLRCANHQDHSPASMPVNRSNRCPGC